MNYQKVGYYKNCGIKVSSFEACDENIQKINESTPLKKKKKPTYTTNKEAAAPTPSSSSSTLLLPTLLDKLGIVSWLERDGIVHKHPNLFTPAGWVRRFLFDPFLRNTKQTWDQRAGRCVVLGLLSGIYVAVWRLLIESGLHVIWKSIPYFLVDQLGVPAQVVSLVYMPFVMSLGCGICGVGFSLLQDDVPDQNRLIDDLYETGRTCYKSPGYVFLLTTLAMWSGLPLGPELPLLLVSAMIGSWVSVQCKLDKDDSGILYLAAQAAAIGGFFQYPIGGALFPLEVPQQTGLQNASALIPSILASIVATVVSCAVTNSDVDRMFDFDGLPVTLSCPMLLLAVAVSVVGTLIGIVYAKVVKTVKSVADNLLEKDHDRHQHDIIVTYMDIPDAEMDSAAASYFDREMHKKAAMEQSKLQRQARTCQRIRFFLKCASIGLVNSIVCTIFPFCFSWGEEQIQNLMNGGKSVDLPFFSGDSPLVGNYALCLPHPEGISIGCMVAIPVLKMATIGLVLATGIGCGHFWGPIFVSAAASKVLMSVLGLSFSSTQLAPFESIVILAMMSSVHVVTFRSPLAAAFILAQCMGSIEALVLAMVAANVAFHGAYGTVFYKAQRNPFAVKEEFTMTEPFFDESSSCSSMSMLYGSDSNLDSSFEV